MKWAFFYTDLLMWALFLLLLGWALYSVFVKKNYHDFLKLFKKKLVAFSFFVLCFFYAIALLDSLHYQLIDPVTQKEGRIQSLLDGLFKPLIENSEKSYSAPLAIFSFSKENVQVDETTTQRVYPRLQKAGSHLTDEKKHSADVIVKFLQSAVFALIVLLIFMAARLLFIYLRQRKFPQKFLQEENVIASKQNLWQSWLSDLQASYFSYLLAFFFFWFVGITVFVAPYYHIMGTDKTGNDVFYVALKGARAGIVIGALTTLIVTPLAIVMGMAAGYLGGIIDDIIQFLYTTLASIPSILLIAAAMLLFQLGFTKEASEISADKRLMYLCIIIGITSWTGLCRLIRAETLKLKEIEYVQAAKTLGISHWGIMFRHIMPNVMHIVIITIILSFSGLVLAEAVLAYVGIGVDPSMHSWGNMINQARLELSRDPIVWWNLSAAFTFMLLLVLSANIFGDALRDLLDPKTRRKL